VLFVVGLVVGFCPAIGKTFSLSRIIVFAPFFWLGTMAQNTDFIGACKRIPKWMAGLLLVATVVLVAYLTPQNWLNVRETVRGASCYDVDNQVVGLISRAVCYVLAIVLSISVTSIVTSSKLLCQIGKGSLKFYLFHGIALSIMVFLKLPWNWYFAIAYGVLLMVVFYFFNKTKLSDFAIRPFNYVVNLIKSKKQDK
jgi:fucose 4-O-acetylase-like acetyltransferase